jgi:hypothetical protein
MAKPIRIMGGKHGAALLAKPVYICKGCGVWHEQPKPPVQCISCGRLDFWRFESKTEGKRWATLLMLEKRGVISGLERQVRFPLYAYGPRGERVEVAFYLADFVYWRDPETRVIEDTKPDAGADRLAALKLKWMAAMGLPVLITT